MQNEKSYYQGKSVSFGDLIAEKFTIDDRIKVDEFLVLKYMYRFRSKGTPIEDLKKAAAYINDMIELLETKNAQLTTYSMHIDTKTN